MHEQNKNMNKVETIKKKQINSGAEEDNSWIEEFTRGPQQWTWSSRKINKVGEVIWNCPEKKNWKKKKSERA